VNQRAGTGLSWRKRIKQNKTTEEEKEREGGNRGVCGGAQLTKDIRRKANHEEGLRKKTWGTGGPGESGKIDCMGDSCGTDVEIGGRANCRESREPRLRREKRGEKYLLQPREKSGGKKSQGMYREICRKKEDGMGEIESRGNDWSYTSSKTNPLV